MARRLARVALCLAAAAAACAALAPPVLPAAAPRRDIRGHVVSQALADRFWRTQKAADTRAERQDGSASQEAKEERLDDLTADEALEALRADFASVVDADAEAPGAGQQVEEYLSPRTARVDLGGGGQGLLISSAPLRAVDDSGELRPTDVSLVDVGGRRVPRNAPFELTVGERYEQGFRLGPDPAHQVAVTPIEPAPASSGTTSVDGKLFFDNVRADTDQLILPTAAGVETFDQIRSASAPESASYRLDPAAGLTPAIADGGLVVRDGDGNAVVRAPAPEAVDALGRPVAARFELSGAVLTLHVDHRSADVAYPVLLDPDWQSTYNWAGDPNTGNEGWFNPDAPASDAYYYAFATAAAGVGGLWLMPKGGLTYPEGAKASLVWAVPGTARIESVTWHGVHHFNDAHRQVMRLAVYGSATSPPAFDHFDTSPGFYLPSLTQADPAAASTSAQMWMFTPPCAAGENNCPRFIPNSNDTSARVSAVDIVLVDNDNPTVAASGGLWDMRDRYLNPSGVATVRLDAHDPGSGIQAIALDATDSGGNHPFSLDQPVCDGSHRTPGQGSAICPQNYPRDVGVNTGLLPEGRIDFVSGASDLAGNYGAGAAWSLYVDRGAPSIAATGALRDLGGQWSNPHGPHALNLQVDDNRSGVKSVELVLRNASGDQTLWSRDACPAPRSAAQGPCPSRYSPSFSLDDAGVLPEGRNTFIVRATDQVGNATGDSLTWDVYVDRQAPTLSAAGTLRDLEDSWTNPEGQLRVALEAADARSGVAEQRLIMRSESGDETIVGTTETCPSPAPPPDSCERSATDEYVIDGADLPEGHVTFAAEAVDHTGNATETDALTWEVHVDRSAPQVSLSGQLAALEGDWSNEAGLVEAQIDAVDEFSGIARVELLATNSDGSAVVAAADVCTAPAAYTGAEAPCPLEVSQTLEFDASKLPDGPTKFTARAVEYTGHLAREKLTVSFDQTPPPAPAQITITPQDDTTAVSWDRVEDPPGGSGVSGYQYQVQIEGQPAGRWLDSPSPHATIGGIPPGVTVTVLVRAIDRALNDGRTRRGDRRREVHAAQAFTNCQPHIDRVDNLRSPPIYEAFEPGFASVHLALRVYCQSVDSRFDRIVIQTGVAMWDGSGHRSSDFRKLTGRDKRIDFKRPGPRAVLYFNGPVALCSPSMGGKKKYAAYGRITYVDNQGRDFTREWDSGRGGIGPGPKTGDCPTYAERRQREENGWKWLSQRRPDGKGGGRPNAILARWMGRPPFRAGRKNAWQAHHTVPVGQRGADDLRALMFRCMVHPNEAGNGIYLRGSGFRKDKRGYHLLKLYDKHHGTQYHRRAYHADTFGDRYVKLLRANYLRVTLSSNRERSDCWGREKRRRVLGHLSHAGNRLAVSRFGVETNR